MRLAALIGVFGLVLAVLGTAAPAGAPTVTCGSIVVPGGSFSWTPERVVLGVVDVPPARISRAVPTGERRWPYWSKAGIVVRADSAPVTISVAQAWRRRAAIGWGTVDAAASLRFATCPDSSALGGWNPYAGGFLLRVRAACVPLMVRVGDRSTTVRVGIGKRCA
jgi:hypothetical protein